MPNIKKIHKAYYNPIANLQTFTPLPSEALPQIDPFLLLNHHGPQQYPPQNGGLPFGPHPHRGMETVTFIFDGDIMHKDSAGNESVIYPGGVQYMSAGSGLIHAEQSSAAFKQEGGPLEILQMWLNMPAKDKMNKPFYHNYQKEDIPVLQLEGLDIQLIAGEWLGKKAAFETSTDVHLATMYFEGGAELNLQIASERNIFFYVVRGSLVVQGSLVPKLHLVEFDHDDNSLHIKAAEQSLLIIGHAPALNENLVARGPFVMNTEAEIAQAYQDYRQGKFGQWNW